ncbi:MAG: hypothetical protein WC679_11780 [Bacteroidales bacterium]
MNIKKQLDEVWSKEYINLLHPLVKDRGYIFCENNLQKDILITGINPSFINGKDENVQKYDFYNTKGSFWNNIKKILSTNINGNKIDLINNSTYLDLFYFKETKQSFIHNNLFNNNGLLFLADQLSLTQYTIEKVIKPKVIIVANKGSYAYWGKLQNKGIVWMGYEFESIKEIQYGEICRIKGLINSPNRIANKIIETSLKDTLVLFSQHISWRTPTEKIPTAELIDTLLKCYNKECDLTEV